MNRRERRFVAEYLIDADRVAAAIRAGYKPSRARQRASALMQNPELRFALQKAQRAQGVRTGITRERVLRELARIAFADLARMMGWTETDLAPLPWARLGADDAAAIAGLTAGKDGAVELKLHDKGFALEILAQYFDLFEDETAAAPSAKARLMERLKPYLAAPEEKA
jgi:phage terminase small subunit